MADGGAALDNVRDRVGHALAQFLASQRSVLLSAGDELLPALDAVTGLAASGKRLRAAFCYWGWRGAGGPDIPGIITAAAALELLHAGALVHDDVMDGSDTRRGSPSLHRRFEAQREDMGWRGAAGSFGTGAAIIAGDLLLTWTGEMFRASGLPPDALTRGQRVLDLMRTEVMAGQYLDLVAQAASDSSLQRALRVVEFKTAKYTIERPLHLGAALAAQVPDAVFQAYSDYGLPLGLAFQLRDDILGVFGDPDLTGKPAGDDLREGKQTVLIAITRTRASLAEAAVIDRALGNPSLGPPGLAALRAVISESGALAECERMIEQQVSQALASLQRAPVTSEARDALAELAIAATARLD
jgi:geranylgeranyl diphosphate synthase type I